MIDLILKGLGLAAAGVAAWYADEKVKEKTGKHIHEHVVDWLKVFWNRLREWARNYLAQHDRVRKIYLSPINIAAAAKRALNDGVQKVRVKIFGQSVDSKASETTLAYEDVPLDQISGVLEQAKREPILAVRN